MTGIPRGAARVLCATCASLRLTAEKFTIQSSDAFHIQEAGIFEIGSGRGPSKLGTLSEIRARSTNCPLCSLVWLSVQEQTDDDLSENESVMGDTCHASWQLDGREILRAKDEITTKVRTRRIRLEWKSDHFQDSYIVLLPDQPWAQDSLFMGRHV